MLINRGTRCFLSCLITAQLIMFLAQPARTDEVVILNDQRYQVPTQDGMPLPFKSREIEIQGLGPAFRESGKAFWVFSGKLHVTGEFIVTVTTLLNPFASIKFRCSGPGDILERIFSNDDYPETWQWIEDPGTSWIPFVFRFNNVQDNKKFEAIQWTKFDPDVKVKLKRALKGMQK
jgi:hypothetical protein